MTTRQERREQNRREQAEVDEAIADFDADGRRATRNAALRAEGIAALLGREPSATPTTRSAS
jgi:hypothetical protein